MEPKFQTSFIPKKPIVSGDGSGIKVIHSTNIFSVVATVVFLVTIIISIGLFVYKSVVSGQLDQAKKDLESARGAIEPEKIKELIDANSRIISTKTLLDNHIASSKILLLLQDLTIKKMRFNDFVYSNVENKIDLSISGEAGSYNALAQQESILSQNEFFRELEISDINLTDSGTVSVKLSIKIDPSLVSYKKAVETNIENE